MSNSEPVAWAVLLAEGERIYDVYGVEEEAKAIDAAVAGNHGIAPLYRSPTLTDEERGAITRAIAAQEHRAADMHPRSWIAADIDDDCDTLRRLLERTREKPVSTDIPKNEGFPASENARIQKNQ